MVYDFSQNSVLSAATIALRRVHEVIFSANKSRNEKPHLEEQNRQLHSLLQH